MKSPFTEKEIKYFRKILKKEEKAIDKEIAAVRQLLDDQKYYIERTEMDFGSDASKIRNREMLQKMHKRLRARKKDHADALQKIKSGRYGICEKTGKKISKQRLMALPTARTSIRMKA
ncbi:MAG: hypothetical protein HKN76_09765 [Saprospiraceae bacterium]|nr:hypothetical protein [Saprospiraceae bacterium]